MIRRHYVLAYGRTPAAAAAGCRREHVGRHRCGRPARLIEFDLMRQAHPFASARIATVLHSIGVVAVVLFGGLTAAVFTVLQGVGNGLLTIAKGTLPLVLLRPAGYE